MSMNRRDFLKGGAVLGGAAALSALAGCAPAPSSGSGGEATGWMPETWDYEADLIVVGAGAAGNAAAIEATDRGLSVIVIEALSQLMGSSSLCNGGISMPGTPLQKEQGIEDSPELMYEDLVKTTGPYNIPELIKVHCDNVGGLWDWLTGMGIEFKKESLIGTVGQSLPREHHVAPTEVVQTLNAKAKDNGAEFLMETVGKKLVQNPDTQRIIGIMAEAKGKTIYLKAKRAVLLATNGFTRNPDMLNKYYPGLGDVMAFSGQHDMGEGILMAQEIGADVRNMWNFNLLPAQHPSGDAAAAAGMMNVGAIMVNKEGERFCDESLGYSQTWGFVAQQTDQQSFQVWDKALYDAYYSNDSSLYNMEKLERTGTLLTADTLEGLADVMGVPVEPFVATVAKYNGDIEATGVDSTFGRDHLVSENGDLIPVSTPPFYGFQGSLVMYTTPGGLKENERSQVLNMFDEPIPGLYCAGGICNYAKYGVDIEHHTLKSPSGIGFGGAIVYGRLVAGYVSELDAWE